MVWRVVVHFDLGVKSGNCKCLVTKLKISFPDVFFNSMKPNWHIGEKTL